MMLSDVFRPSYSCFLVEYVLEYNALFISAEFERRLTSFLQLGVNSSIGHQITKLNGQICHLEHRLLFV